MDGNPVPEKDASGKTNWTKTKGSVIVELQASYLETLSVGKHSLTACFDDGNDATAEFTVKEKEVKPSNTVIIISAQDETTAAETAAKATVSAAPRSGNTTGTPATGDESNLLLWFVLMAASLFVIFRIISLRTRRFYDR